MEKLYAKAIDDLSRREGAKGKELVAQLVAHLATTGRRKILPGILRELKTLEARRAKHAPFVEVAHASEAEHALTQAKKEGIEATKTHVNPSLVSGWRARSGGILIDRSAKRGLIDLYRAVTK